MRKLILAAACLLVLPGMAQSQPEGSPEAIDYSVESSWLCLPGRQDACAQPLPTVDLRPDSYGPVRDVRPASDPPIDCFYVYPTVSRDPAMNSDMNAGPEEQGVAFVQFARFASLCRPFAPLYRQATLASIPAIVGGRDVTPIFALAYGDLLAAWRRYLAHHNDGRPFVLIGHSQGTIHLTRLLAAEIEGRPEAERMLSALLIGYNVEVPEGQLVGGSFRATPLCTRRGEINCVISYVSFRATNPPPALSLFGRTARPGMTVACTNPAALGGGSAPLDSIWFARSAAATQAEINWSADGEPPAPFLSTLGLASAACARSGTSAYLSVAVNPNPGDARTDAIPGDVRIAGRVQPAWGLHLADMDLAMGDLIDLVEAQGETWRRRPAR